MPPGKKLQPAQVSAIRQWIDMGAPWTPDSAKAGKPKGADHWAFQPVRRTDPPPVRDASWVRNPIDSVHSGAPGKGALEAIARSGTRRRCCGG